MNRILCIMLFFAFAAYGQEQERIAIMRVVDDRDSIDVSDLGYFADKLSDIAGRVLPKSQYSIVTQQGTEECKEAACLADLGRKIGADYISWSRIGRFGGELMTIKAELYSAGSGTLVGSFTGDSKDLKGLLSVLESKAPKLFEDMPGFSPAPAPDSAAAPAAKKECESKFNINELAFKIQSEFPAHLKDCSATLAKDIALSKSPFGKKTELKEPKAFMTQCAMDGIRKEFPEGLDADRYIGSIEKFLQGVLGAASAADGELDVNKLSKAIGDMDIGGLLDGIRKLAGEDDCMADEPYEPPVALEGKEEGESEGKKGKRRWSLGLRGGMNSSHLYAEYDYDYHHASGSYKSLQLYQFGLVFDWALNDWFHLQPGAMLIVKGSDHDDDSGYRPVFAYIEIPLLLSFKFSVLRINAGPYFGICIGDDTSNDPPDYRYEYDSKKYNDYYNTSPFDFGLSAGFGFDIWKFYIGVFYDYGLTESYSYSYHEKGNNININHSLSAYNRTFGFNLGINL